MTITDITPVPKAKSRYRIFIDEEFAFVLYKGELRHYDIDVGNELSIESYHEIITKVLPKRAKLRALNLLKSSRYTEYQIRTKLTKAAYTNHEHLDTIIDETINYLKSYKYLDDEQYTKDYITCYITAKSRNRLSQDLQKKGIPKEMAETIYLELLTETSTAAEDIETTQDEIETTQIQALLKKKKYNKDTADLKTKQRTFAFLFRKGYSPESISKFIK